MLKKIGIGLVVVIAALVAVIFTRPDTYRVERSVMVSAPADLAYAQVADFLKWNAWSPWAKMDPQQKTTLTGTTGAVGSSYAWEGNDKVGSGRMTVTAVKPNEQVEIKLDFIKPFESTATTTFSFQQQGQGTKVSWTMAGNSSFLSKALSLVKSMDEMIGGDFDHGLAGIKTVSEAEAKKRAEEEAAAAAAAKAKAEAEAKAAAEAAKAAEEAGPAGGDAKKVAAPSKP